MRIERNYLEGLSQEQVHKNQGQAKVGTSFEALLHQDSAINANVASNVATNTSGLNAQAGLAPRLEEKAHITQIGASKTLNEGQNVSENHALSDLDGLLTMWDNYANNIGSTTGNLRDAYQALENMEQKLGSLKDSAGSFTANTGLAAMLNELEVMATTEKFKFNRGDYLA